MTGIVIALLIAMACALALRIGARLSLKEMAAPVAALLLGLAGYAWQGRPNLIGHPVKAAAAATFDERLAEKRRSIGERLGPASKWLVMSDGLARQGDTEDAANILVAGLKQYPRDANLWVGLGNALLAHNAGRLSPAAYHAYAQALKLEPDGVSPNYFLGLALAQSGQFADARVIWSGLIGRLPETAEIRGELQRNIVLLDRLIAAQAALESGKGTGTGQ